jgi:hypothetical protein
MFDLNLLKPLLKIQHLLTGFGFLLRMFFKCLYSKALRALLTTINKPVFTTHPREHAQHFYW